MKTAALTAPIPNLKTAPNAIGFRNFDDCEKIMKLSKTCDNIVVMGAGLVGIDVISGLTHTGKSIALVEMKDRMLSIQLDKKSALAYEKGFESKGVKQYYEKGINEPNDDTFEVEIQSDEYGNYKKIIHKEGKIYGAVIQGDLSYTGVLTQLRKVQNKFKILEK